MDWLIMGLAAAFLFGAVSVLDKVVIEKHINDPLIYVFIMSCFGLVSALVTGWMAPIHFWPTGATFLAVLSGFLYLSYLILYFAAMGRIDATVVVALAHISPVFAAIWDTVIFGQTFGWLSYTGVALIILGAIFVSLDCDYDTDT